MQIKPWFEKIVQIWIENRIYSSIQKKIYFNKITIQEGSGLWAISDLMHFSILANKPVIEGENPA